MAKKIGYLNEDTFTNIASAIREKNGETGTYTPSQMPDKIRAISTGDSDTADATASANDILADKTAYVKGAKVTGNIASKDSETYNPSDTDQTISAGQYLSGSQIIAAVTADNIPSSLKENKTVDGSLTDATTVTPSTGKVLTSVTVNAPDTTGTASADDILNGKTAYVNGTQVTGNITTNTKISTTINPGSSTTITKGYYSEDGTVSASLATTEAQIDSTLKSAGSAETIVPGGSATVSGGKYYTSDTTVSASLATTEAQIDSTLKSAGSAETIVPGGSATVSGGKYYTSDTTVSASLATTEAQIDSTLKDTLTDFSIAAGESTTIDGGVFYTNGCTITANKATTEEQINDSIKETKTETGSLTSDITITPTTGKILTSVTITKPDMSSADVTADDIVSGKKAYGSDGTLITGSHTEASGGDTTDATASADDIVSGKTAYIADGKVTGTLEVINCYSGTTEPSSSLGTSGDLYIMMEGVSTYSINKTLTGCKLSNNASSVEENSSYEATIIEDTNYTINNVVITMGGSNVTDTVYSTDTNTISIPTVTGNVVIVVTTTYTDATIDDEVGSVASDTNVISLNDSLASDTYTLYYEDENGTLSEYDSIGTITQ